MLENFPVTSPHQNMVIILATWMLQLFSLVVFFFFFGRNIFSCSCYHHIYHRRRRGCHCFFDLVRLYIKTF